MPTDRMVHNPVDYTATILKEPLRRLSMLRALVIVLFLAACTDADHANHALISSGYTDIIIGDYAFFECAEDDFYHTSFSATNPTGLRVSGTVCSGLVAKGATIRF